MDIMGLIKPIFMGVWIVIIIFLVLYFFYWILKQLGVKIGGRTKKVKIPDDVYRYVAREIAKGKELKDIAQYITRFEKDKQLQYLNAYYEIIELKGGKNK